jgi:glycosyltransferase involved in cell wall biosynthesis
MCDVSVVIPNFNRTTLLSRALTSIKNQSFRPSEVIVVDDCSDQERLSEIRDIVDRARPGLHISLLINDRNHGANWSRNRGIFEAKSKYVAFLDSDDLWMPNKLEIQMSQIAIAETLDERPILSGTGRYRVNDTAQIIARQPGARVLNSKKIRRSNFIGTLSSVVVDAAAARNILGFDETLHACQDWDFFIRLSDFVQYVGIAEPLCVYVDHAGERISLKNKKRLAAHFFIYHKHIKPFRRSLGIDVGPFCKNVAEEYQQDQKFRKANIFYASYMAKTGGTSGWKKLIPKWAWPAIYAIINAPDIKAKRYSRYERTLRDYRFKPNGRQKLKTDGEIISEMMGMVV